VPVPADPEGVPAPVRSGGRARPFPFFFPFRLIDVKVYW